MKKIIPFIAAAGLLFASCNSSTDAGVKTESTISENTKPAPEVTNVPVKNQYSLDIPNSMSKGTGLHEDASLQYQNLFKELYVVVIDEPQSDFDKVLKDNALDKKYGSGLEAYTKVVTENFTVENIKKTPLKDVTINGLSAKTMEVEGVIDGHGIYYNMAIVKGKEHYYQVLAWTLLSKKDDNKPLLETMVNSFKELNK